MSAWLYLNTQSRICVGGAAEDVAAFDAEHGERMKRLGQMPKFEFNSDFARDFLPTWVGALPDTDVIARYETASGGTIDNWMQRASSQHPRLRIRLAWVSFDGQDLSPSEGSKSYLAGEAMAEDAVVQKRGRKR